VTEVGVIDGVGVGVTGVEVGVWLGSGETHI
jgi:hypothetical protein